jgi:hypothetical protein
MAVTFSVLTGLPAAAICLVGRDKPCVTSRHNFPGDLADATEASRASSFCAWTLISSHENGQVLILDDARVDPIFREHPAVTGAPHVRRWGGAS